MAPTAEALTGYFTAFQEGAASEAADRAKKAELVQSEVAHRAAENAALVLAFQAEKAAVEASSYAAVEQERAAHVSNAAQVAQSQAYTAGAYLMQLSKRYALYTPHILMSI